MDGGPTDVARHEDRAQGPDRPGRGGGTGGGGENGGHGGLEIGVADRRLDALMEEDRRAMSVPVQPGVQRLALVMVEHNGSSMAGRGDGAQPRQDALSGVPICWEIRGQETLD